jgi:predicted dehydrogenase
METQIAAPAKGAPATPLGLGLVGCGGFGRFCLEAYRAVPGLRLVAASDNDPGRLQATAADFGLQPYSDYAALLADPAVHIVAINTPPSLHGPQAVAAARAGKHIFCEKPLATSLDDATAVLRAVRDAGVVLSVDYVMRWNPLYWFLKHIQTVQVGDSPLLGPLQRYALENGAGDEQLAPAHWFWDPAISGGIFVEHGVHFFDACAWLAGTPVTVVQGLSLPRREPAGGNGGALLVDTVAATAVHTGGTIAGYYHAFTHANRAEYQSITLDWGFAHGVLYGWIPVDLDLEIWTDAAGCAQLEAMAGATDLLRVPGATPTGHEAITVQVVDHYGDATLWRGRGRARSVSDRVRLHVTLGGEAAKQQVYLTSVQAGMADLIGAITEGRAPRVTGLDAWHSLATAVAAQDATTGGCRVAPRPLPADLGPTLE